MINVAFLSEMFEQNKSKNEEDVDDIRTQNCCHSKICLGVKHIDKTKEKVAH